jgi:invasion protein IalB
MLISRQVRLADMLRLAGILAILALQTGHADAQGAVKSVHADWQIRCDTPPGAQAEQCALIQSVTAEDRANIGCVAEVVMDENLMKQLRTGQTATFIIFQTPEEGIGFPMALKGFGEGYDKLP